MALISDGSMVLLSTNLTMCAIRKVFGNPVGAVHKELDNSYIPQYIAVVNMGMSKWCIQRKRGPKRNTHCVRIKVVLVPSSLQTVP